MKRIKIPILISRHTKAKFHYHFEIKILTLPNNLIHQTGIIIQ